MIREITAISKITAPTMPVTHAANLNSFIVSFFRLILTVFTRKIRNIKIQVNSYIIGLLGKIF